MELETGEVKDAMLEIAMVLVWAKVWAPELALYWEFVRG